MTRPVDQVDVENEIIRLSALLEDATNAYVAQITVAAEREVEYRIAYAKAFYEGPKGEKLTEKMREAWATEQCAELLRVRRSKEAVRDAATENLRSLRARISAVQTLSANVRGQV